MGSLERWVPRLISAGAAVHLALAVTDEAFRDLVGAGLVSGVGGDAGRESALWFASLGLSLAALGEVARWSVRETGRLPAPLGWWMIGMGALVSAADPASGGWAVVLVGALAAYAGRSPAARATRVAPPVARG